jgi:hypothetical protein
MTLIRCFTFIEFDGILGLARLDDLDQLNSNLLSLMAF